MSRQESLRPSSVYRPSTAARLFSGMAGGAAFAALLQLTLLLRVRASDDPLSTNPASIGSFADRSALLIARDAWCENATSAAAAYGPIGNWDVSRVTDLSYVFCSAYGSCYTGEYSAYAETHVSCEEAGCNIKCATFNDDVSNWTTSSVTSLDFTFRSAAQFNQPLLWDTSRVSSMLWTFKSATAFNQCVADDQSGPVLAPRVAHVENARLARFAQAAALGHGVAPRTAAGHL